MTCPCKAGAAGLAAANDDRFGVVGGTDAGRAVPFALAERVLHLAPGETVAVPMDCNQLRVESLTGPEHLRARLDNRGGGKLRQGQELLAPPGGRFRALELTNEHGSLPAVVELGLANGRIIDRSLTLAGSGFDVVPTGTNSTVRTIGAHRYVNNFNASGYYNVSNTFSAEGQLRTASLMFKSSGNAYFFLSWGDSNIEEDRTEIVGFATSTYPYWQLQSGLQIPAGYKLRAFVQAGAYLNASWDGDAASLDA